MYDNLNDYELVSQAQELNEDAINILNEKYRPLIQKKCRKYIKYLKNKGLELEDLYQECILAFNDAITNFNELDDVSFYTFQNLCIDRKLVSELVKHNREKNKILNEAVPLEIYEKGKEVNLEDLIQDNKPNPELGIVQEEDLNLLIDNVLSELTDLEEFVFKLKIEGFNYKEISDILDKDEKSIDNVIQRIKQKMKVLLNKNTY